MWSQFFDWNVFGVFNRPRVLNFAQQTVGILPFTRVTSAERLCLGLSV